MGFFVSLALNPRQPSRSQRSRGAALLAAFALTLALPARALQVVTTGGEAMGGTLAGTSFADASWRITAAVDESQSTNTILTVPGVGAFDLWWLSANPRLTIETAAGPLEADLLPSAPFRWIVLSGLFPVGPSPKLGFVYTTPSFFPETAAGIFGVPGSYTDLRQPLQLLGPSILEAGTYPTSLGPLVVSSPAPVTPGFFRIQPVPGPLPSVGAATALAWSRRLRQRARRTGRLPRPW
jgi:hypothetical protein